MNDLLPMGDREGIEQSSSSDEAEKAIAESSLVSDLIAYISNEENLEKLQGVTRDSSHPHYFKQEETQTIENFEFLALQIRPVEPDNVFKVSRGRESIILRWVNNRPDLSATIEKIRSDPILKDYVAVAHCTTLIKDKNDGTKKLETHNLIIGDFYQQGNLKDYLEKIKDPLERARRALDFTGQLFDILIALSDKNIGWSDLKLTNLLVDDRGHLKISDLKGLIQRSDLSGVTVRDFVSYTTESHLPEDLFDSKITDFRKLSSYQMGVTICEMLMPGSPEHALDSNSLVRKEIESIIVSAPGSTGYY